VGTLNSNNTRNNQVQNKMVTFENSQGEATGQDDPESSLNNEANSENFSKRAAGE
jgi:hypothetical protein